jgi:membrane-associated protease RseP (regulator of RpoE activity)
MNLQHKFTKINIVVFAALFSITCGVKAAQTTEESKALLQELQQQISATVAAIAESEKRAGNDAKSLHIVLNIPGRESPNLGLILDVDDEKGFRVLSVSLGSLAETLNIEPGDVITSINGVDTRKNTPQTVFAELESLITGDTLVIDLKKKGALSTIETKITGKYTPPIRIEIGDSSVVTAKSVNIDSNEVDESACGKVSVFFKPPSTRNLYSAYITHINDENVRDSRSSFRLPVGKHTLYLHELISDSFFKRRSKLPQRPKTIEIDVEENTTYYLAAQFFPENKFKERNGEYWEPVIWKERADAACEL